MLLTQAVMQNRMPTRIGRAAIMSAVHRRAAIEHYRWGAMSILKRTQWTEDDVLTLPSGEHDYFDRKSGGDFTADRGNFLTFVGKALSAFANSGGGHLILGQRDDGVTFDGLPPTEGRTPLREWLEQKIPNLVAYELQDFRVHEVLRSTPSKIPTGRVVIVVDVGDSALAPHQTAHGPKHYYMRQAGHSEIAPHHYLELLRQRVQGPVLRAADIQVQAGAAYEAANGHTILPITFRFQVRNDGRIAAYKWALYVNGHDANGKSPDDFTFDKHTPLPANQHYRMGSISLDDTILPGMDTERLIEMGVRLRPDTANYMPDMHREIVRVLGARVIFRIATETSPGEPFEVRLGDYLDPDAVLASVCAQLGIN